MRVGSSRDQVGAPLPAAGPAYNVSSSRRAGRVDIYVPNMARAAPNGRRNIQYHNDFVSPSSLAVPLSPMRGWKEEARLARTCFVLLLSGRSVVWGVSFCCVVCCGSCGVVL